jgi:hypothetical protein
MFVVGVGLDPLPLPQYCSIRKMGKKKIVAVVIVECRSQQFDVYTPLYKGEYRPREIRLKHYFRIIK